MVRAPRWSLKLLSVLIVSVTVAACGVTGGAAPAPTATPAPAATATTAPATTPTPAPAQTPATSAAGPTVQTAQNPLLGTILVNSAGMTLYTFKNDTPGVSNCTGQCAANWPPLVVASGQQPTAASGVTGQIGTIQRSDGTTQVTYNGLPVYLFARDQKPGDINGQAIADLWSVVVVAPPASSPSIALLLPETKTARYETQDRPLFEAKFKMLCPTCTIIYSNANQDANAQASQVEAALTNGAKVLVLDPVDSAAAASLADKAKAQGVPVIAYDRQILNSDGVTYYISFDNAKVGQLQAQSLVDALNALGKTNPTIVMINGAPTDNNAALFKQGAHSVFDPLVQAGKLTIAKEYDTPDWSPDQAQNEMQQALTALSNKVDGVYAANDGTAGGAIAAMIAAGVNPLPPVTGQDAELAAIQRIISGQQYMTVYKAIKPEAEDAAQLAFDLLLNNTAGASNLTQGKTVNNGKIDVPSVILTPVAVTKDNVKTTVVADGFWTVQQICTSAYAAACTAAGLQ